MASTEPYVVAFRCVHGITCMSRDMTFVLLGMNRRVFLLHIIVLLKPTSRCASCFWGRRRWCRTVKFVMVPPTYLPTYVTRPPVPLVGRPFFVFRRRFPLLVCDWQITLLPFGAHFVKSCFSSLETYFLQVYIYILIAVDVNARIVSSFL